jgi:hypothetical protein
MTDIYNVYNAVNAIMCSHCNETIRRKCSVLPDDTRFKTKIHCMHQILKRDDEEYPIRLPKVDK